MIGNYIGVRPKVFSSGPGYDPDAQAYMTGQGIVTNQAAWNTWYLSAKAHGYYNKLSDLKFTIFNDANKNAYDAITPGSQTATWVNSPTHASNRVTFNGTNQYAKTGYNNTGINNNSFGKFAFVKADMSLNWAAIISMYDSLGAPGVYMDRNGATDDNLYLTALGVGFTKPRSHSLPYSGYLSVGRKNNTTAAHYIDGAYVETANNRTLLGGGDTYIGMFNNTDFANVAVQYFGDSIYMTEQNQIDFAADVATLFTALGV